MSRNRSDGSDPGASGRPRICVVAHRSFGAVSGRGGYIGGVEWQTALTAKWLARAGHCVSMITWDEGWPDGEPIDGVRVLRACRVDAGMPAVRFIHPRWTTLVAALRRADADVYYHNTAECVTGQVALWCRRNRRGFVFSSASNADVDSALPILTHRRERVLYRMGLRRADRLIVQTETQRRMLR